MSDPRALWLRAEQRRRIARGRYFDPSLFADPVWDILIDLRAASLEGRTVSVSSACIAAAVAQTTALRHIKKLVEVGHLVRFYDRRDRRRNYLQLSEAASERMDCFIERVAPTPTPAPMPSRPLSACEAIAEIGRIVGSVR